MFSSTSRAAQFIGAGVVGVLMAACQSATPPTAATNWDFSNMHLVPPRQVVTLNAAPIDNSATSDQIIRVEIPWRPPAYVDESDMGGGDYIDYGDGGGEE